MSGAIKPGDMVLVAHWKRCCAAIPHNWLGYVGTVRAINSRGVTCPMCGTVWCATGLPSANVSFDVTNGHIPIAWLKRIDPNATPARIERPEELTA